MPRVSKKSPCCDMMSFQLNQVCEQHPDPYDCPDFLIDASGPGRPGLIIHDGGHSVITIRYCPWCGSKMKKRR